MPYFTPHIFYQVARGGVHLAKTLRIYVLGVEMPMPIPQYIYSIYIADTTTPPSHTYFIPCFPPGGERGRVHLAKILRGGCNLLLLDTFINI